jgi:pimeloyl-ACP methyl ester carboxylesterase
MNGVSESKLKRHSLFPAISAIAVIVAGAVITADAQVMTPMVTYQFPSSSASLPPTSAIISYHYLEPPYGGTPTSVESPTVSYVFEQLFASAPSITAEPTGSAVTQGNAVFLTVQATGSPPLTYQWKIYGVAIPGATSATYTIDKVTAANAGTYTVVVTNSVGLTLSSGAILSVNVPVIFIPGVGGSELWLPRRLADSREWPNQAIPSIPSLLSPGGVHNLQFDLTGIPANPDSQAIYAPTLLPPILSLPWPLNNKDIYRWDVLVNSLAVSGRTVDLFPYDFRYSPESNAVLLRDRIQSLCPNPGDQVDIVAHSMGGLVALAYAQFYQSREHRVRRLATIGTPFLGAPRALQALRAGWNLDVPFFDQSNVKRMAHNWPGLYSLLPSPTLQDESKLGPTWFRSTMPSDPTTPFWLALEPISPSGFKEALMSFSEPNDPDFNPLDSTDPTPQALLSASILNQTFLNIVARGAGLPPEISALTIAGQVVDSQNRVMAITPRRFDERPRFLYRVVEGSGLVLTQETEWFYVLEGWRGDGTVPVESALGLKNLSSQPSFNVKATTVLIENAGSVHTALVKDPIVCDLATRFLNGESVTEVPPLAMTNGSVTIVAHSPVVLDIADAQGRHTTISGDAIVRDNPDTWADYFGEAKALVLPATLAANITIRGVDNGAVTLEIISSNAAGVPIGYQKWLEFPVTRFSMGGLKISAAGSAALDWDANGDGRLDYSGGPDSDGDGVPNVGDLYPNTPLDAVVNRDGGCLAQIVPLLGNWKSQGEYISEFTRTARTFVDDGLMTSNEVAQAIKLATEQYPSGGKPNPPKPQQVPWSHQRKYWKPIGPLVR